MFLFLELAEPPNVTIDDDDDIVIIRVLDKLIPGSERMG